MKVSGLVMAAALSLSGCGILDGASSPFSGGGGLRGAQTEVNGVRFRTRVSAVTEDDRGFVTTTRGAGRSPSAAAEAGRVQAVEYCLRRFGGSDIVWTAGPDRAPTATSLDQSGALLLAGTCVTR